MKIGIRKSFLKAKNDTYIKNIEVIFIKSSIIGPKPNFSSNLLIAN